MAEGSAAPATGTYDATSVRQLEAERDALRAELDQARAQIAAITDSRFWRYSAPLRGATGRARRFFSTPASVLDFSQLGVWDFVKLYARALRNHFSRGQYDPDGVQAWLHLWIRTNGMVNAVTSLALRPFQSRQRYDATTGLLGTFTPSQRSEIVKAIRRDSYYVFPQKMPEQVMAILDDLMRDAPGEVFPPPTGGPTHAVYDPQKPLGPAYWYQKPISAANQMLMTDENFVAIATEYVGVDPVLGLSQSWLSLPITSGPSSENAQLYHFDPMHLMWLNFYVYLTDVDAGKGPHCLIRGTHTPLDFTGAKLRRRGVVRVTDEDIYATYGKEREVEITGPRGTVLAVDTRSFHKGKQPTTGLRRIFQLHYANSDFGLPTGVFPVDRPTPEYAAAFKRWPTMLKNYPIRQEEGGSAA